MTSPNSFLLAIGSALSETSTSKLTTSGTRYEVKSLNSKPENWTSIVSLLGNPNLIGAIVKFTGKDYERLMNPAYSRVADSLLDQLVNVPHLVLVHEAVAGLGALLPAVETDDEDDANYWDDGSWNDRAAQEFFGDVGPEIRSGVDSLFARHAVTITTYKRNAEKSVLAASFIDDLQSNLLFRVYVPKGRIYEDELAKLLEMFHEWLGSVKNQNVREGGYRTSYGRVIEFFSDGASDAEGWKADLVEFSNFLNIVDNPQAAKSMLLSLGVENERADDLVTRYSRDARRVLLDSRHERDRITLGIQQRLEAELSDDESGVSAAALEQLVKQLVPTTPLSTMRAIAGATPMEGVVTAPPTVIINQQYFEHVEGIVAQNISGTVTLGTPAEDLIALVREFGGERPDHMENAVREVADPGAPVETRIKARQALKAFLIRNGERIEAAAFQIAWKWLEAQIGHM